MASAEGHASGTLRTVTAAALVALYFAAVAAAAIDVALHFGRFAPAPILAARLCAVALALGVAWRLAAQRGRGVPLLGAARPALLLRLAAYGGLAGLVGPTLVTSAGKLLPGDPHLVPLFGDFALLGIGAFLLAASRSAPPRRGLRFLRVLDVVAFNVLLALLVGEVVFRVLQRVAPSQLLWDDSSAARNVVALRRCEPSLWFRYRCNQRGYPDEEFSAPGPESYDVALLADSFGVGSVPWEHHFATLAERELRERFGARYKRVGIDNFGVIGIGLPEYRYLLDSEVRALPYEQVVLCFFVGNDLGTLLPEEGPWGRLARFQGWLVPEVARRAWNVLSGVERLRPPADLDLDEEPAFLRDPSLEPPYFKPAEFLAIEQHSAVYTRRGNRSVELLYRRALARLDGFREALGPRLLVVLIPDEFQVNDALWQAVLEELTRSKRLPPSTFDRDYPQERIRAWARARGVRVLDLLPALREAERQSRTYHLRDTHWNAHGNRVAGRELARALLAYAESSERP